MNIFRAEWRKLRRPTLFFGSMGVVVAVTALIVSLLFLLIDSEMGNADRGVRITREVLALPTGISLGFSNSSGLLWPCSTLRLCGSNRSGVHLWNA